MGILKRHKVYAKKYKDEYRVKINNKYDLDFYTDEKLLSKYKKDLEEGKSKYITFIDKKDNISYDGLTILREEIRSFDWKQEYDIFCEYYRTPEEMLAKEKELKNNGWIIEE